jgi:hypothetical protein
MTKSARRFGSTCVEEDEFRELGFIVRDEGVRKSLSLNLVVWVARLLRKLNFNQAGNFVFFKFIVFADIREP